MEKVITVHLGHTPFLIDESSFEVLKKYLDEAKDKLSENPDCDEIITDIEFAIAEKLSSKVNASTDVVQFKDLSNVLEEMGPIQNPEKTNENSTDKNETEEHDYTKKLYQIPKGAILTGVCNGLGAYLTVDVLLVRIVFVILTILTKGLGVFLYGLLALIIPYADTIEKESKAHGKPFNAQTLTNQARENYDRLTTDKKMHDRWNSLIYEWRDKLVEFFNVPPRRRRMRRARYARVNNLTAAVFSPVIGVLSAALFIALVYSIYTVTTQNQIFTFSVPQSIPLWAAILGVVLIYLTFHTPLASVKTSMSIYNPSASALSGFMEAFVILGVGFLAYQNFPEAKEFMDQVPQIIESTVKAIKEAKGK